MDMSPEEFRRAGHDTVDWIADYLAAFASAIPCCPMVKPGELTDALPDHASRMQASPSTAILAISSAVIVPAITHWNHPRILRLLRQHRHRARAFWARCWRPR